VPISPAAVRALASLARLRLSDAEAVRVAADLDSILARLDALPPAEPGGGAPPPLPDPRHPPHPPRPPGADPLLLPLPELAPAWTDGFFRVPRLAPFRDDPAGGPGGG
jgi:hypothetical protein